ncbi:MAG: UDP-N-acetylmuramate dehydrogenase [Spirochaetales bacterium]|jgi:UDP-N-acetylmuramate dehydrogenase|nr:UDP-N-acetylmuramate dehydrogenase [Spirochaetales bacterium]
MASNVRNQSEKIKFAKQSLAQCSHIGTGGEAPYLIRPTTLEQLRSAVEVAQQKDLSFQVFGALTNTLVSDKGIDQIAIDTSSLTDISVQGNLLVAQCGALMDDVIDRAIDSGLGGLERLGGLPGTVGGAVHGNSGANGLLTSDLLYWVDYLNKEGELLRLRAHPESFSYRHSPFMGRDDLVIYEAAFKLEPITNTLEVRRIKEEFKASRNKKGQYRYPSIGCIFRNPDGQSAGKLIDSVGLKGYSIGGATVSSDHANFITNPNGEATSSDVKALIEHIKKTVKEKTGISLDEEIRYLGQW